MKVDLAMPKASSKARSQQLRPLHLILPLMAVLAAAACSTSKKSDPANPASPTAGNGAGTGGRNRGGFGGMGGTQTGSFFVYANVANPPTGVVTTAPAVAAPAAPTGTDTTTPPAAPTMTGVNESGFRIACTTDAGAAVNSMTLTLKLVKSTGAEYDSTLTYKSTCSDFARITVSQLAAGDVANLTVAMSTLAGVPYATGTIDPYTQGAIAAPAATTTTAADGSTRRSFTPPVSTEVQVAMKAPPATAGTTAKAASLLDE